MDSATFETTRVGSPNLVMLDNDMLHEKTDNVIVMQVRVCTKFDIVGDTTCSWMMLWCLFLCVCSCSYMCEYVCGCVCNASLSSMLFFM